MPTLTAGIGLLVLLAVGAVMVVHWIVDRDVVQDFATALVMRVLSAEEAAVRRHLDAAVHQGDFIAAAISGGRYKLADPAFENFVGGSFAAAPQVDALVVGDADGNVLRVVRLPSGAGAQVDRISIRDDSQLGRFANFIRGRKEPYWGPPVYRKARGETFLNYCVPIWSGENYLGFVMIGISNSSAFQICEELSAPPRTTAFMVYEDDRVLAHPLMATGKSRPIRSDTFPPLRSLGDPVIADLGHLADDPRVPLRLPPGVLARRSSGQRRILFRFCPRNLRLQGIADHGRNLRSRARDRCSDQAALLGDIAGDGDARRRPDCRSDHGDRDLAADSPRGQRRDGHRPA